MPRDGYGIYPLARCVQWFIAYQREKPSNQFTGGGSVARNKKDDWQARMLEQKFEERAGNLVSKMDVYTTFGNGMLKLGVAMDGVPSIIGRRLGLTPEQIKMIRTELDELRKNFARDCEKYAEAADRITEKPANAGPAKRRTSKVS